MPLPWIPRPREEVLLSEQLARRSPGSVRMRGLAGSGVSRLLREVLRGRPHLLVPVPPLPPEGIRAHIEGALRPALAAAGVDLADRAGPGPGSSPPGWGDLIRLAATLAPAPAEDAGPPFVLALDDAHRIPSEGSAALIGALRALEGRPLPFHLLLAGTGTFDPAPPPEEAGVSATGAGLEILLDALSPRAWSRFFPRWSPTERLLGWAIFGGLPARIAAIGTGATLASAVRDSILDPDGPLHHAPWRELERTVQAPGRYAAILSACARGARWRDLAGTPAGRRDGAMPGPYLRTLEAQGWIRSAPPLGAPAGSRRRRYRIADPFVLFWLTEVLPRQPRLQQVGAAEVWTQEVRLGLDRQMERVLSVLAQEWLRHDAVPALGSTARELGAIWGEGIELDAVATLRTGSMAYGRCSWRDAPFGENDLLRLDEAVRATRYGFGREARHRILFGKGEATPELRSKVARDPLLHIVGIRELTGEA